MKNYYICAFRVLGMMVLLLTTMCFGEGEDGAAPMEETERAALYSVIQGFVGNLWNGSDLYPDPCGWTPIQGVSCDIYDGLWYVTTLAIGPIQDNSPSCACNVEFRPELFELKHLKSLTFYGCFMSPHKHPIILPSNNWEHLSGTLETLEFRSNPGLVGQVPVGFGELTKLQSLVLLENGLTGELPEIVGNLINLKRLVLSGNGFNGRIPDSFGALKELLIMDLSRNLLPGSLPFTFGGMTSLLKLDLSNNQLDGNLPMTLNYLKNLTLLDLRSNRFTGGLTKSLQELISLEEMALSHNPIGGDLHRINWQNLQNLAILDLSNTRLTGDIPESIAELKRLRYLGLNNNYLTGSISPRLASLPSVTSLYLNGNNLTGKLEFSKQFYAKMGRRFGAWNNPSLCYPVSLLSKYAPFGVKPFRQQQEISLLEVKYLK